MKKIIFLSCFIFSVFFQKVQAQMVVEDPAMLTATVSNWGKSLESATQQFNELKEQSDILKQGIEKYKQVNTTIKSSKQVKSLIDRQVKTIGLLSDELVNAKKDVVNLDAQESYVRRLTYILNQSKDNVVTLTDILTDSKLNLSDYERLKLLEDLDKKSANLLYSTQREKQRYNDLNIRLKEIKRLTNK